MIEPKSSPRPVFKSVRRRDEGGPQSAAQLSGTGPRAEPMKAVPEPDRKTAVLIVVRHVGGDGDGDAPFLATEMEGEQPHLGAGRPVQARRRLGEPGRLIVGAEPQAQPAPDDLALQSVGSQP